MVEVRAARLEEFPLAAGMREEMAREMGRSFDERSNDWRSRFCAHFGGKQAAGRAQLFFAAEGEEIVGMAMVSVVEHYRTEVFGEFHARINAVFVRPEFRRRGTAMRLMQAAIGWARERRCHVVTLDASDDGRPLYEKLGFERTNDMALGLSNPC